MIVDRSSISINIVTFILKMKDSRKLLNVELPCSKRNSNQEDWTRSSVMHLRTRSRTKAIVQLLWWTISNFVKVFPTWWPVTKATSIHLLVPKVWCFSSRHPKCSKMPNSQRKCHLQIFVLFTRKKLRKMTVLIILTCILVKSWWTFCPRLENKGSNIPQSIHKKLPWNSLLSASRLTIRIKTISTERNIRKNSSNSFWIVN